MAPPTANGSSPGDSGDMATPSLLSFRSTEIQRESQVTPAGQKNPKVSDGDRPASRLLRAGVASLT